MKKIIKICALVGLILFLAGCGITACAAFMGGRYHSPTANTPFWRGMVRWIDRWDGFDHWDSDWDNDWDDHWDGDWDIDWDNDWNDNWGVEERWEHWDKNHPNEDYTLEEHLVDLDFSSVNELELDIRTGILRVYEKEGISQIQVLIEDKHQKTRCFIDENTLEIQQETYSYKNYAPRIDVQVPTDYHFEEVSLDTGVGDCQVTGISTSRLEIDTGVGVIAFAGTVTREVELDTGVGDVTLNLTGKETDYNYTIDFGVGAIQIGNTSYSGLSRNKTVDNQASRHMDLDCGVGNVTITFTDSL